MSSTSPSVVTMVRSFWLAGSSAFLVTVTSTLPDTSGLLFEVAWIVAFPSEIPLIV